MTTSAKKTESMRTIVIVSAVGKGLEREALELLEGQVYPTFLDAQKVVYNSEDNFDREYIQMMELTDFMDSWNNEEISTETWIGYIYVENN